VDAPAERRHPRRGSIGLPIALALVVAALATTAGALDYSGPSLVTSSGTFEAVPGGEIAITDGPEGFSIVGDVRASNAGAHFIRVSRPFTISDLPETIESTASEHWKMVLAGGSCCPATGSAFSVMTEVSIFEAGGMNGATQPVTVQSVYSPDHEIAWLDVFYTDVLGASLPFALEPGDYVLDFTIHFTFEPGGPADFPESGFIEFGGVTAFDGFDVTASGTPVPEPSVALLRIAALAGLSILSRVRAGSS